MEHAVHELQNEIVRCLVSQDQHDSKRRGMNVVDALLKLDRTISFKGDPADEIVDVLNRIAEELSGIRNSVSAIAMLTEDGYMRPIINCTNDTPKKRKG